MEKTTDQMLADIQAIFNEEDAPIEEGAPVRGVSTLRTPPRNLLAHLHRPAPEPPRIVVQALEELHIMVQDFFDHIHRAVGELHMLSTFYPHAQWRVSQSCENYWAWCVELLGIIAEAEDDNTRTN